MIFVFIVFFVVNQSSFVFLLEREPKEAILTRFELPVIEQYFPNYAALIEGMID